jgi:hypothetical protein
MTWLHRRGGGGGGYRLGTDVSFPRRHLSHLSRYAFARCLIFVTLVYLSLRERDSRGIYKGHCRCHAEVYTSRKCAELRADKMRDKRDKLVAINCQYLVSEASIHDIFVGLSRAK